MQQVVVMITSAHLLSLRSGFALKTFLKKGCLQMKCNPIGHERREELLGSMCIENLETNMM